VHWSKTGTTFLKDPKVLIFLDKKKTDAKSISIRFLPF